MLESAGKMSKARRGRPAGKPLSRRELRARRANLRKARGAPKGLIYRPTAKRLAASLENLRKAVAARRSKEGSGRARLNALKHGVYSRQLVDESVRPLGESERELAGHRELFARLLVPQNESEAVIVWELSNLAWRRLRVFRAAAERERRELRRLLLQYPPPRPLSAPETLERMHLLFATLDNCDRVIAEASKLRFEMRQFFQMLADRRPAPDPEKIAEAGCQAPGEDQTLDRMEAVCAEGPAEQADPGQESLDPFSNTETGDETN
jgi:hypothetical protein